MLETTDNADPLSSLLDGLITQNHQLGHRQLALQTICASLIAEVCLASADPNQKLLRLSAELNGAAMGIADRVERHATVKDCGTREITKAVESMTRIAEETVHSRLQQSTIHVDEADADRAKQPSKALEIGPMRHIASAFVQSNSGATAIEYGLIAALIGTAIIGGANALGGALNNTFAYLAGLLP